MYFTLRFTALHSAVRVSLRVSLRFTAPRVFDCSQSLPWQVSNQQRSKSSSGPINLQLVCENHPSLERKASKRLTASLLALFFRPSPSRLSPGRNTVFVPSERIVQHHASFPLWGIKREHGPIRSPSSPSAMRSPENRQKRTQKQQKQHQTTKQEKPHYRSGQDSSIPAAYVLKVGPLPLQGVGKGAKNTQHVAETRGPSSQDPGDHNATPTGHNRHHNPKKAIMRYMRESMDQQQAPCRGMQCKHKFNDKKGVKQN